MFAHIRPDYFARAVGLAPASTDLTLCGGAPYRSTLQFNVATFGVTEPAVAGRWTWEETVCSAERGEAVRVRPLRDRVVRLISAFVIWAAFLIAWISDPPTDGEIY